MFRRSVALIQLADGRTLLRRVRPCAGWGSLALSRFMGSRWSPKKRESAPASRKLGWSLRSSLARPAPYRGLPRPRTPAPFGFRFGAPSPSSRYSRCGMLVARLSRGVCLLRCRYEPPAARRRSLVRACRLLAALRSISGVWPLLRSRQHCLSAGAYRCPLPVGGGLRVVKSAVLGWGVFETSPRLRVRWPALTDAPPFFICLVAASFSPFGLAVGARCRAPVAPSPRLPSPRRAGSRSSRSATLRPSHGGSGFGSAVVGGGLRPPPPLFCRLTRWGLSCGLGATLPRSSGWARSSLRSCRPQWSALVGRLQLRTTLPSFRPLSSPPPAASSLWSSAPAF